MTWSIAVIILLAVGLVSALWYIRSHNRRFNELGENYRRLNNGLEVSTLLIEMYRADRKSQSSMHRQEVRNLTLSIREFEQKNDWLKQRCLDTEDKLKEAESDGKLWFNRAQNYASEVAKLTEMMLPYANGYGSGLGHWPGAKAFDRVRERFGDRPELTQSAMMGYLTYRNDDAAGVEDFDLRLTEALRSRA